MRYTVTWTAQAQNDLTELWLQAADRNAIEQPANSMDRFLAENPNARRCEVVSGHGTLMAGPLGVDFQVRDGDQVVIVQAIWLAKV
jgi:plasmid stabilization system protein ParE